MLLYIQFKVLFHSNSTPLWFLALQLGENIASLQFHHGVLTLCICMCLIHLRHDAGHVSCLHLDISSCLCLVHCNFIHRQCCPYCLMKFQKLLLQYSQEIMKCLLFLTNFRDHLMHICLRQSLVVTFIEHYTLSIPELL